MISIHTAVALLLVVAASPALADNEHRAIITAANGETVLKHEYVADLEAKGVTGITKICLQGAWLVYDHKNFNEGVNSKMEYMYKAVDSKCYDVSGWSPLSIRHAGDPMDFKKDSISLYPNTYFQGTEEEKIYEDTGVLKLNKRVASLVIEGSSPWTVYDGPNHTGNFLCLPNGKNNIPMFIFSTKDLTIQVAHDTIRSVKKGCFGTKSILPGTDHLIQQ